jgi:hypothetical protein
MIIVFVNVFRTFLLGVFIAAGSAFVAWNNIKTHFAATTVIVPVIFSLFGLLMMAFAIRTADRALRALIR